MIELVLAALFIGIAAACLITRALLKQLDGKPTAAVDPANRIASDDMSVAVAVKHGDQSSLMFAIAAMRTCDGSRLKTVVLAFDAIFGSQLLAPTPN